MGTFAWMLANAGSTKGGTCQLPTQSLATRCAWGPRLPLTCGTNDSAVLVSLPILRCTPNFLGAHEANRRVVVFLIAQVKYGMAISILVAVVLVPSHFSKAEEAKQGVSVHASA